MKQRQLSVWSILSIVLTVVLALAVSAVPLGAGAGSMTWPNLTLCVVFFWMIHRPMGLPTLAVMATGLAHDLIGGGIAGAGMLALLTGSFFLRPVADALDKSAFAPRWIAFAAFAGGVFLIEWSLTSLPRWSLIPIGAPLAQYLVTVLAYVPVSVLFRKVLRIGRT